MEAKMGWASLDMEADQLRLKLHNKNKALKMFSAQVTKLEIELVCAKQQLGDALNHIQEMETQNLRDGVPPFMGTANDRRIRESRNMSDERASEESKSEGASFDSKDDPMNQNLSFDEQPPPKQNSTSPS